MKFWGEITQNAQGHTVAKDLFKAVSFFSGLFYLLILVPAVVLATGGKIVLPMDPGMALVTLAFGLQTLKEVGTFFDRKSKDGDGNPLAQPGTTSPPADPKLMPQEESFPV